MIRFIDLRGQILEETDDAGEPLPIEQQPVNFAFFDTVRDEFLKLSGAQEWSSRAEFEADLADGDSYWREQRERFLGLMPEWVR